MGRVGSSKLVRGQRGQRFVLLGRAVDDRMGVSEGYTYAHIWRALRHDRHFDAVFYAEVFLVLTMRVLTRY